MRKLLMFNLVSLDGFFEGANRDISWHNVDAEFNECAIEMLNSVDMLIFGRVTYELMVSYWPTPAAMNDDPIVADKMNNLPKLVFSQTLDKTDWNNTIVVKDNIEEEIRKIIQQPGKDIVILGSGSIVSQLTQSRQIDEYRIMVNPVILGRGTPLLKGISNQLALKLLSARTFRNGNVLLCYKPEV